MPKRPRHTRPRVTLLSRFTRELHTLSLADRCLFVIFLVLLAQSAWILFTPAPEAGGEIDIVVRTASASIFGYLLGGGMSGSQPVPEPAPEEAALPLPEQPAMPAAVMPELRPMTAVPDAVRPFAAGCSRFRVLAAAGVGLFCLLSLLLLRDWPGKAAQLAGSAGGTAMLAQFRDFISGALGFLTGCTSRSTGSSPD